MKPRRVVAPKIATLPDDDPASLVQDLSTAPAHQDEEDGDVCEEGRDDIMIMSSINMVDIHRVSWSPTADVQVDPIDIKKDSDADAIRAQVNTDAHVSCTDQKHTLHGYQEFTQSRPSLVKLMPATVNSDAVSKGVGYLNICQHLLMKKLMGTLPVTKNCT